MRLRAWMQTSNSLSKRSLFRCSNTAFRVKSLKPSLLLKKWRSDTQMIGPAWLNQSANSCSVSESANGLINTLDLFADQTECEFGDSTIAEKKLTLNKSN